MKLFIILESSLLLVLTSVLSVRCWTYIGCFTHYEISQRIGSYDPDHTPLSSCFIQCGLRNRKYLIVKKTDISAEWDPPAYTVDCYCVNDLPTSSRTTCNYQCTGGTCGSLNAMSVYSVCDRGIWGWHDQYVLRQCNKQCHCAGGAISSLYDGLCPGACADTYWGHSCDKACDCDSTAAPTCHKETGVCNCIPVRYGARCDLRCHCAHGAACRQSDGRCPGQCEGGYWGDSCDKSCYCDSTGPPTCHKENGQCNCIVGRYGDWCERRCHCAGYTACQQNDGQCPGQCKRGYWGYSCDKSCDCDSTGAPTCHKWNGQCNCIPDRYGAKCDNKIPYDGVGCFSMNNIQSAAIATETIDTQDHDTALQQCRSYCIGNQNGYFAVHPSTSMFTCYCLSDLSVEESEECPDSQLAAALTVSVVWVEVYTTCPLGTYDSRGDGSCNMYCGCTQTENWSGICSSDGAAVHCVTCSSGWTGELCAVDVNECMEGDHTCGPVGQCLNLPGSYQCQCPAGYHPATDSKSCVDVNECTERVHDCQQICTNTNGSYTCSCEDGYIIDKNMQSCTEDHREAGKGQQNIFTTTTLSALAAGVILVVLAAVVIPTIIIILRRRKLKDGNDGNPRTTDDNNDHEMYAAVVRQRRPVT